MSAVFEIKSTSHKDEKVHSYTLDFKLSAIAYAEAHGNRSSARKFDVDVKRIREWKKGKTAIADKQKAATGRGSRKRIDGGGKKPKDVNLEENLMEWVSQRRENKLRVSRKLIMFKARALHKERVGEDSVEKNVFVASRGWLENFMRRYGLSLRRRTTTIQKDPEHLTDKLVSYVVHVRRMCKKNSYDPANVIAMDETAVWADMVAETTVEKTGKKEIALKTTGHEKVRVTVCLAAQANGKKLKPFILFGGAKREAKILDQEFKTKCVVRSSPNGWMNEELTLDWVQNVLGRFSFTRRLLSWDSFDSHMTDDVRNLLQTSKVEDVIIPGGCTKYIQAPDLSWNKPFKATMTERYDDWLANGVMEYTEQGNLKAPSRKLMVEWIIDSWSKLTIEMIQKSFKACALNLNVDGSEDSLIHCFKKDQPCEKGYAKLQQQLGILQDESSNYNPFENGDLEEIPQECQVDSDHDSDEELLDILG